MFNFHDISLLVIETVQENPQGAKLPVVK